MKTKLFCTAFVIGIAINTTTALASERNNSFPIVQNSFKDSVEVECCTGKKNSNIRLFPNPTTNGKLTITSVVNEPLHFYVFDLDGALIQQVVLKGKEQKKINDLKKGTYTYDVFKNDESVEQGKIIVK